MKKISYADSIRHFAESMTRLSKNTIKSAFNGILDFEDKYIDMKNI